MTKGQKTPQGTVKARVLVSCSHGKPNDVIEIDADLAETLGAAIDTSAEAVSYAESLAQ